MGINDKGETWDSIWTRSNEAQRVRIELARIQDEMQQIHRSRAAAVASEGPHEHTEFAVSFTTQLLVVTERIFRQYWRMPSYIFGKLTLAIFAGLFIGFTFFDTDYTNTGNQKVVYSTFLITTIFNTLVRQIQPLFIIQRSLYEIRERPNKVYSWQVFLAANVLAEIPWQILSGVLIYACLYYPVVGIQEPQRQGLVLLYVVQLLLYSSVFAQMTVVAINDAIAAASIASFLTVMSILFCGVLQSPDALPGFWQFMYRVSPFTYWVSGIVSTELHGTKISCSPKEASVFDPPLGLTCEVYLWPLLRRGIGQLLNPSAMASCQYCPANNADQLLAPLGIYWSERWTNFGILWAYIAFSLVTVVLLYCLFRTRR
jgi:ABC-type multidrug transport system permease subunit